MKKLLLLTISTILSGISFSQDYNANRYIKPIFPTIDVTNNVQYGTAPQWVWPYWNNDLFLNVNIPNGDANIKRPLIIFAHAGGFINGTKDVDDMVAICDSFAQKGYVTASIEYRKGFDPLDGSSAERAVYRGIQDGKTAIRFFKTNYATYNIDTNYVFFGGMSAGAFIALHVGYMDKESERPASTFGGGTVNDLGCLDCGDHQTTATSKPFAILDFWGAMQDTSLIESNGPPIQLMHGRYDPTVPFKYGHPFGASTVPSVYGDSIVQLQLDNIGIYNEYTWSDGPLHMLDGSNNGTWDPVPNSFWSDTLLPKTTNFCYQLIKPQTSFVSPQFLTLCQGNNSTLEVSSGLTPDSHYEWFFDNTNISTITNNFENTISLEFPTTGTYSVKVIEFNEILCAGDTLEFTIDILPLPIANFTYFSDVATFDFTSTSSGASNYNWDFGDGTTSTDQNPSHEYTSNGDYTVTLIVTSADGCISETSTQIVSVFSLTVNEFELELTYISPFSNELVLRSSQPLNTISIYSMDGKEVYSDLLINLNTTINSSDWENGIYILNFIDSNGNNQQRKLVKM